MDYVSEQQQQPQIRTNPYSSPLHNLAGSIILLTNPENELHKAELTMRSIIQDKDGNLRATGDPLMNEQGVGSVIGQAQALINQVTVMSNLNKNEIPMLIDLLADTLARDLMVNRKKYEIKNVAARDKIYFIVLSSAYICMKRAFEEGEKRFWKGSQQEITTRIEGYSGGQKRGGLLGSIFGGLRR